MPSPSLTSLTSLTYLPTYLPTGPGSYNLISETGATARKMKIAPLHMLISTNKSGPGPGSYDLQPGYAAIAPASPVVKRLSGFVGKELQTSIFPAADRVSNNLRAQMNRAEQAWKAAAAKS